MNVFPQSNKTIKKYQLNYFKFLILIKEIIKLS